MTDNSSSYNSNIYDENIINTLPYYREYAEQILDIARTLGKDHMNWLDTGCGTGTLAVKVLERFDNVSFTLCDPSADMLDVAKTKLQGRDIRYVNCASHELPFSDEFDILTAVQCHHYYQPEDRKIAVRKCYDALKPSGVFITFENIRMSADESDSIAMKRWLNFQRDHGRSEDDVQKHAARRGKVMFPITIEEHIQLLRECGFKTVDILWTAYLQAGFWAIK